MFLADANQRFSPLAGYRCLGRAGADRDSNVAWFRPFEIEFRCSARNAK